MSRLLKIVVLCLALDTHVAGEGAASFAVPFFELEELKVSGGIAVGRFASLIDDRSLYAIQLRDGRVLARIDRVGRAPFALDGERLVYAADAARTVVGLDLATSDREELWKIPSGHCVVSIDIVDGTVQVTAEAPGGVRSRWPMPRGAGRQSSSDEFAVRPERRDGR